MGKVAEPKDMDLIDKREYRKRYRSWVGKHSEEFQEFMNIPSENKVSWGTIIESNAQKYADNIAIKFEDISLTFKELNEWINRYTNYFLSLGLKKGDVVKIMMTNRPEYIMVFYALGKIGAIGSLINIDLREMSLVHCLKLTPGKFIIIDENCFNNFNAVISDLELSNDQILHFMPDQGLISTPEGYIDLSLAVKNFPIHNPSTTSLVKTTDDIAYLFTSGTTGFPKATIMRHYTLISSYYFYGRGLGDLTTQDIMYVSLPLFHANAIGAGCAASLGSGATVAIGRSFSVSNFWDEIRKYNATAFNYIGEVCRYLMNQPPRDDDLNNSVRVVIGPGLRHEIWKDFKERFNIEKIGEYYSASEAVGAFGNVLNFDNTIGCCLTSFAIVKYNHDEEKPIRNNEGFMEKVEVGQSGLLLFENTGVSTFRGYTDKEATDAKLFHNVFNEGDEWFNTGDLIKDLGNNHAQFIDRLGDTYRWKGNNISTIEIEKVINSFDQVLFSTAYGVQIPGTDGRAGMVALVPNTSIEEFNLKELMRIFKQNLPAYAIPIFLRFKSKLSVTATFKFKKVKLKNEAFELEKIDDPLYVLLPGKSEYIPLTRDIYENIIIGQYRF